MEARASEAKKSLLPRCHANFTPIFRCPRVASAIPSSLFEFDCVCVHEACQEFKVLFARQPGSRLQNGQREKRKSLSLLKPRALWSKVVPEFHDVGAQSQEAPCSSKDIQERAGEAHTAISATAFLQVNSLPRAVASFAAIMYGDLERRLPRLG